MTQLLYTPLPLKKNLYEVEVEYMHGDADAYTHNTFTFENEEELLGFISSFDRVSDMIDSAYENEEIEEVVDTLFEDLDPLEPDCTDDYLCSFAAMYINKITHFNGDGIAFDVEIQRE